MTNHPAALFPSSRIPFRDRGGLQAFPNGARLAFLFYSAAEEWNWDETEQGLDPFPLARFGEKQLALSMRSAIAYGFQVGLPRICEVLRDVGMKATMWTNGNAVEQQRDVVELLHTEGHELGGHGYSEGWPMTALTREQQADHIARSVELLSSVSGKAPTSWVGPGAGANRDTVELLAEAGFLAHGDLQDDELPYFLHVGDRTLVEIPYRMISNLNDVPLMTQAGRMRSVADATDYLTQSFDASYAEAARRPLLVNFGTHPHVSGRPDHCEVMRRFLEYVASHEDVWVCTYAELAAWWQEQFGHLVPEDGGDIDVSSTSRL